MNEDETKTIDLDDKKKDDQKTKDEKEKVYL